FYPRAAQPGLVALESRFPEATRAALARRDHRLRIGEAWSEGRLSGCARETTPEGTALKAAANPRRMQGYAVGRSGRRLPPGDGRACRGRPVRDGKSLAGVDWTADGCLGVGARARPAVKPGAARLPSEGPHSEC